MSCFTFTDVLDGEQNVRVVLNVGGQRHETFLNTLENFPDTRLAWISEQLRKNPGRDREFFFDRHPGIFAHVLNYFRTGKLHVPRDICGPMFEQELAFWGIDPKQIEHCCWAYYDEHNELEKTWGELMSAAPVDTFSDQEEFFSEGEMAGSESESTWSHAAKKKWRGFRKRMWRVLEDPYSSKVAWVINLLSVLLSILGMLIFCLSSLPEFTDKSSKAYEVSFGLETFVITFFTIELILRLVTAPSKRKVLWEKSVWVDLFSILPYFITLAFREEESLEILKVVYVLRLYRAFEAFRFSYVLQVFIQTITGSIRELLLLLFICSILVITFGALAYHAERKAPKNDGFENIPASFWWSLITMTTVGYGDVSPTTVGGKIVGCACAITGVLLLALPTSIVTTNFSLYNAYAKAKMKLPPRKKTQVVSQALKSVQLRSREGLRSSMNSPTSYSVLSKTGLDVAFSGNALNSAGMIGSPRTRRQALSPLAIELESIGVTATNQSNGLNHVTRRRSSYS